MADDSLDVMKMNVKPGGKQRLRRDGCWDGKVQKKEKRLILKVLLKEYKWYWRSVEFILIQREQMK